MQRCTPVIGEQLGLMDACEIRRRACPELSWSAWRPERGALGPCIRAGSVERFPASFRVPCCAIACQSCKCAARFAHWQRRPLFYKGFPPFHQAPLALRMPAAHACTKYPQGVSGFHMQRSLFPCAALHLVSMLREQNSRHCAVPDGTRCRSQQDTLVGPLTRGYLKKMQTRPMTMLMMNSPA